MAYEIFELDDAVICARISDFMQPSDQKAMQALAADWIEKGRKLRLLVVLENFRGWTRSEEWADVGFLTDQGENIVRMAIVGEERWRDDVLLFVGKGFRTTQIEYFPENERREAEAWVSA